MNSSQHIYADNASTTRLDPDALEAMLPLMRDGFANPSALHSGAKKARRAVEDVARPRDGRRCGCNRTLQNTLGIGVLFDAQTINPMASTSSESRVH